MTLVIEKSPSFHTAVTSQFRWYKDEAGEELAWRFFNAVDMTIHKLSSQPDLGRRRRFRHPALRELWSYRVEPPFSRLLIFYRVTERGLNIWRLMHGARDLSHRLLEPPDLTD